MQLWGKCFWWFHDRTQPTLLNYSVCMCTLLCTEWCGSRGCRLPWCWESWGVLWGCGQVKGRSLATPSSSTAPGKKELSLSLGYRNIQVGDKWWIFFHGWWEPHGNHIHFETCCAHTVVQIDGSVPNKELMTLVWILSHKTSNYRVSPWAGNITIAT